MARVVPRNAILAYAVAALVLLTDQVSKAWVLGPLDLDGRGPIQVLPFFSLHMVRNEGVSFGLLRAGSDAMRWLLVAFSAGVIALLVWWALRQTRRLAAASLGLIIGGAIGNNFIDRVRFGSVVDFLDFSGLHFPWVFNVADSAISIGVVLLLLDSLITREERPAPKA